MMSHLGRERDLRYMEVGLIIKAIVSAANAMNGKDSGSALSDLFREYTDATYPERAGKLEDKAAKTKRILEREFSKGPMKVQAQNYDKKPKKRRK
jgi:hypothetical protein